MLPRLLLVRPMHQHMPELVGESLHLRGVVHVRAHGDLPGRVVRQPVRAADHALVRHPQQLEPLRRDLLRQTLAQTFGGFASEQPWRWPFGDRIAAGLGGVPDVGRAHADHAGAHDLTGLRLLTPVQTPPGVRIGRVRRGEPASDRGEDLIPGLALLDLSAQLLPLLVSRDQGGERFGHPAGLECGLVLLPDQADVVEAPRPEPGSEPHRIGPVLTGDQPFDGTGELLVELVELRFPLLAGFLPRRHRRPPLGRPAARSRLALHQRGEPGASGESDGQRTEQSVGWPSGHGRHLTWTYWRISLRACVGLEAAESGRTPDEVMISRTTLLLSIRDNRAHGAVATRAEPDVLDECLRRP